MELEEWQARVVRGAFLVASVDCVLHLFVAYLPFFLAHNCLQEVHIPYR